MNFTSNKQVPTKEKKMRGRLVNGKWINKDADEFKEGKFQRSKTVFKNWIKADHSTEYQPEKERYHLYVSYACPWAQRTMIIRKIKGLDEVIGLSIVGPEKTQGDWEFTEEPETILDSVNQAQFLREIYLKADKNYTGRVSVPVLWDKKLNTIVNNESKYIMRMLDTEFDEYAKNQISLYPEDIKEKVDETIHKIYEPINNGVYKCGFAKTQQAYEEAFIALFKALDEWNDVLAYQSYLCGDQITEADICMFTTLFRFDIVYYLLFKCNNKHIYEYSALWDYLKKLYKLPAIKETCNIDHIKRHYYKYLQDINPFQIVPAGPKLKFN
jgi:putative glutathione S-transferase